MKGCHLVYHKGQANGTRGRDSKGLRLEFKPVPVHFNVRASRIHKVLCFTANGEKKPMKWQIVEHGTYHFPKVCGHEIAQTDHSFVWNV